MHLRAAIPPGRPEKEGKFVSESPTPSRPATPARGLFIGRYFQIDFYLDYSWFLIAIILTYTLSTEVFPKWVPGHAPAVHAAMGICGAALFFLCILLHELGHSIVSQRCGIPVPRITLLFIGGLAEISREPDDAKSELKIAAGGPLVSLMLAGIFGAAGWIFWKLGLEPAMAVCSWLSATNVVLVLFNMIPGYPLDGGRILRALLWAQTGKLTRATYITSRIGIGFAWVLILLGLFILVVHKEWWGFVYLLIALFLKSAAESGYSAAIQREVLGGVRVREIMTPNPVCIPDTLPLNLAVDDYFLTNHHVAFPVTTAEGDFRGILRLEFLKDVPREKWPYTTTGDLVAERGTQDWHLPASTPAARAMRTLLNADSGRMAVTENGKTVGFISRHDILHFIEIHATLEA